MIEVRYYIFVTRINKMIDQMKMRLGVTTDKILKHGNIETEGKSTIRAYIMKLKEQLVITDSEAMILQMAWMSQINSELTYEEFLEQLTVAKAQLLISPNPTSLIADVATLRTQIEKKQQISNQYLSEVAPKQREKLKNIQTLRKIVNLKRNSPTVQQNPEYFRIDQQLSHKLYNRYRKMLFGSSSNLSFEQKEQGKSTMSYSKLMLMFSDIEVKLQVNQKLQLLRAIKKMCFNHQFISEEEFTKLFKVVIHGMGFKESLFRDLLKKNVNTSLDDDQENFRRRKKVLSIKLNQNIDRKFKTEGVEGSVNYSSEKVANSTTQFVSELSRSRKMRVEPIKHNQESESASKANISKVSISKVGHSRQAKQNAVIRFRKRTQSDLPPSQQAKGYLNRAMQKNKISKITWQNLLNMTQETMHFNITIPNICDQSSS